MPTFRNSLKALALDFQTPKNLKELVVVVAQNEETNSMYRNDVLSQSAASIFAARPIRSE